MARVKPHISGLRSDHSTNCVGTEAMHPTPKKSFHFAVFNFELKYADLSRGARLAVAGQPRQPLVSRVKQIYLTAKSIKNIISFSPPYLDGPARGRGEGGISASNFNAVRS